jgi:hypothetical protein
VPRLYDEELRICQRYYEKIKLIKWQHFTSSVSCSSTTNDTSFNIPFKVQKRAAPSVNINGSDNEKLQILFYNTWWPLTVVDMGSSEDMVKVGCTFNNSAQRINGVCGAICSIADDPYIEIDAEIY